MAPATIELLYFTECPNAERTRVLIEDVAAEVGVSIDLKLLEVKTPDHVERLRFLGSPTLRVKGRDVEPGADERETFMYACRVYRTEGGLSGQPARDWVRTALVVPTGG
ncbi:MAG TPA: hypothetical protein VH108_03995 [Gaiellaceae bacterium]|nr:hypothetical protein [Gaiellaceae bacterium]